MNAEVLQLDVLTAARLLGIGVPVAVALLAKSAAPAAVKALLNVLFSVVAGVVAPIITGDGAPDGIGQLFNSILNAYISGVVAYYGVLKPVGLTGALNSATGSFGVGSAAPASPSSAPAAVLDEEAGRDDSAAGS